MDTSACEDGNLARTGECINGDMVVEVVPAGHNHRDPLRFKSHFATCEHADKWRKGRPP